jgi:hypothetical protein
MSAIPRVFDIVSIVPVSANDNVQIDITSVPSAETQGAAEPDNHSDITSATSPITGSLRSRSAVAERVRSVLRPEGSWLAADFAEQARWVDAEGSNENREVGSADSIHGSNAINSIAIDNTNSGTGTNADTANSATVSQSGADARTTAGAGASEGALVKKAAVGKVSKKPPGFDDFKKVSRLGVFGGPGEEDSSSLENEQVLVDLLESEHSKPAEQLQSNAATARESQKKPGVENSGVERAVRELMKVYKNGLKNAKSREAADNLTKFYMENWAKLEQKFGTGIREIINTESEAVKSAELRGGYSGDSDLRMLPLKTANEHDAADPATAVPENLRPPRQPTVKATLEQKHSDTATPSRRVRAQEVDETSKGGTKEAQKNEGKSVLHLSAYTDVLDTEENWAKRRDATNKLLLKWREDDEIRVFAGEHALAQWFIRLIPWHIYHAGVGLENRRTGEKYLAEFSPKVLTSATKLVFPDITKDFDLVWNNVGTVSAYDGWPGK